MAREILTDEQVEEEISRLSQSPDVKLAQKELRLKYRRRKYMYDLRQLEKRGKELAACGITADNMEAVLFGETDE